MRPSRIDGAHHAAAVIKLLVGRLRQVGPEKAFIVRGDSGFCRQLSLRWCERHQVGYATGVARNARLQKQGAELEAHYQTQGIKQRRIQEFRYASESWRDQRYLVTRFEFGSPGRNPPVCRDQSRSTGTELHDPLYCQRGEAENRIKEVQLALSGTRASCPCFMANWLRLLLAALAYTLMQRRRSIALAGMELAHAQAHTIRAILLKIGTPIVRNSRRIRILLSSHHPEREFFVSAARAVVT